MKPFPASLQILRMLNLAQSNRAAELTEHENPTEDFACVFSACTFAHYFTSNHDYCFEQITQSRQMTSGEGGRQKKSILTKGHHVCSHNYPG